VARNIKSQPNETRITTGKFVFDEFTLVTRSSDVLDVVERSDAEEPDSGGDDGDANDVFPDNLHGATSVGVRSEHDERNHQQQSPKPTPFHEKHVEHIVLVGHVCFNRR